VYCPQCKAEYRQGFNRCSDCGVDLVHALPTRVPRKVEESEETEEPKGPIVVPEGTEFKALSRWVDSLQCADACLKLRRARIAYKVTEIPQVLGYQMEPRPEFEVAVPTAQYERAREILGIEIELGEKDLPSEEEIHAVMELPAEDDAPVRGGVQGNWDLTNWCPEDATVEVWSGDESKGESDKSWMIELALNENHIRSRSDLLEDGTRHFFVQPEDEVRAREIVREIVEAAPPE
jgi:hypothetical protein